MHAIEAAKFVAGGSDGNLKRGLWYLRALCSMDVDMGIKKNHPSIHEGRGYQRYEKYSKLYVRVRCLYQRMSTEFYLWL